MKTLAETLERQGVVQVVNVCFNKDHLQFWNGNRLMVREKGE